jgi:hypothetical protein
MGEDPLMGDDEGAPVMCGELISHGGIVKACSPEDAAVFDNNTWRFSDVSCSPEAQEGRVDSADGRRWDSGSDQIADIEFGDVATARDTLLAGTTTSVRDAIHVAVMRRLGCTRILTFDRGFDEVPGIKRMA